MKRFIFALGFLLNFACSKTTDSTSTQTQVTQPSIPSVTTPTNFTIQTTNFDFVIPSIKTSQFGFGSELSQTVSCTILYSVNGVQHIISNPSDLTPTPPIHFVYKNNNWALESFYPEAAMDVFRNYVAVDNNGTFAIANHGNETEAPRPYGDLYVVKTIGEKLNWTKVSKFKGFYHSVGVGDLDMNGSFDVVGLNMGSYSNWYDNLHTSLQNNSGGFDEARELISYDRWEGKGNHGAGAVIVLDLVGDKRPEIIRADYGYNPNFPSLRYSFAILKYDDITKKYEFYYTPKDLGVFANNDRGATSIKALDFDKDGDIDLAISTEGTNYNGIQIWVNDGSGNFKPGQNIEFTHDVLQYREFETADIDGDGDIDILLNPFQNGKLFRPNSLGNDPGLGINLQNCILINDNGTYKSYSKSILIPNIQPGFMKGVIFNGKLHYIGFEDLHTNNPSENRFKLHDITITL